MPDQKDIQAFDDELQNKLVEIKSIVGSRQNYTKKDKLLVSFFANTLFPLFTFAYNQFNYFNIYNSFYTDHRCTSCGICKKIRLSGRIELIDGKPKWNEQIKCHYCLACIQYCPVQAIQMKTGKTADKGRYHYPGITVDDIAAQKQ